MSPLLPPHFDPSRSSCQNALRIVNSSTKENGAYYAGESRSASAGKTRHSPWSHPTRWMRDTRSEQQCPREAAVDDRLDVLSRAPLSEALDEDGARALRSRITDGELSRGGRLVPQG